MASVADENALPAGLEATGTPAADAEPDAAQAPPLPFGTLRPEHRPAGGPRYWIALSLASLVGCNAGDLVVSAFGVLDSLPLLIAAFAVLLALEQDGEHRTEAYYWLLVIVARTAATNLADFAGRQVGVPATVPIMAALLLGLAGARRYLGSRPIRNRAACAGKDAVPIDGLSWATMLVAGSLGTAIGDLLSFHLGLGGASLLLSGAVALLIGLKATRLPAAPAPYRLAVIAILAAGTSLGDVLARVAGLWQSAAGVFLLLAAVLTLPSRVWSPPATCPAR